MKEFMEEKHPNAINDDKKVFEMFFKNEELADIGKIKNTIDKFWK